MKSPTLPKAIDIPAQFVLEVASGLKKPADIAAEYGFTPAMWESLQVWQPFVKMVDEKKEELRLEGFSFRMKSAQITENLLDDLYDMATDEDASFHTTLELAKFTARAAGLDAPKKEAETNGANFNISINLGAGNSVSVKSDEVVSGSKRAPLVFEHKDYDMPFDPEEFFSVTATPVYQVPA